MAKFCSECGKQVSETSKFCDMCGITLTQSQSGSSLPPPFQQPIVTAPQQQTEPQQMSQSYVQQRAQQEQYQQQQQYTSPPQHQQPYTKMAKKKNLKPILIACGSGIAVIVLVVVLITTGVFGFFGNLNEMSIFSEDRDTSGGTNSGDNRDVSITVPQNVSDEELIAYIFIDNVLEIYMIGKDCEDLGLHIIADGIYGTTAATICSMRYAVDLMLESMGAGQERDNDRLYDWDSIALFGLASPYPYIFEGIVLEAGGDMDAAIALYEKALLNPAVSEDDHYLRYLVFLDSNQLKALHNELLKIEDMIFAIYTPIPYDIPRDENNWNPEHLRSRALAILEQLDIVDEDDTYYTDEEDEEYNSDGSIKPGIFNVLEYYHAAISLEPFNGNNYARLAAVYLEIEETETAIHWLNEGLFIDPENAALNVLLREIKGAMDE